MGIKNQKKKIRLAKMGKRSRFAPVFAALKKFGMSNRRAAVSRYAMTRHRRNWRRTKLHIKPRKQRKSHLG